MSVVAPGEEDLAPEPIKRGGDMIELPPAPGPDLAVDHAVQEDRYR